MGIRSNSSSRRAEPAITNAACIVQHRAPPGGTDWVAAKSSWMTDGRPTDYRPTLPSGNPKLNNTLPAVNAMYCRPSTA